jgi:uncharacterized protein YndB with AHSA1/START domain
LRLRNCSGTLNGVETTSHAPANHGRRALLEILGKHPSRASRLADGLLNAPPKVSRHQRPAQPADVGAWIGDTSSPAWWQSRLDALHIEITPRKEDPHMLTTGTMRALDERRGAVRVEDVYATDIDDLWEACTTPERLARWIASLSGDLRTGGTIHATFTSTWSGDGRIEICDRPDHLLLTMEPGKDDQAEIEAWLIEEGDMTRLVVEERGLPLEGLHFHGAGWQAHLEDLRRSLAGEPSAWKTRWTELTPVYEAMPLT